MKIFLIEIFNVQSYFKLQVRENDNDVIAGDTTSYVESFNHN